MLMFEEIVISRITMIILSTTINSFLKIDERSIVRIRKALENRTNMEDDRVSLLEQQLAQAKLIAEEADKKYEEVGHQWTKSEKIKGSRTLYFSRLETNYQLFWTFKAMTFVFTMQKYLLKHFHGRNGKLTYKETKERISLSLLK